MKQLLLAIGLIFHGLNACEVSDQSLTTKGVTHTVMDDSIHLWTVAPSLIEKKLIKKHLLKYTELIYSACISRVGSSFKISYVILHPDKSSSKRTLEWHDDAVKRCSGQHRALLNKMERTHRTGRATDQEALECIYDTLILSEQYAVTLQQQRKMNRE
jgi:hypothetical protein